MDVRDLLQPGFIGRDKELSTLKHSLKKAKTSNGSTVFISGETGVGKTGLLEAFKDISTDEGVRVYFGAADMDSGRPFQVLSKVMSDLVDKPLFEEHDYTSFVKIFAIDKGGMLVAQASSEEEEMRMESWVGKCDAVIESLGDGATPVSKGK